MIKYLFLLPILAVQLISCTSASDRGAKEWSAVAIIDGSNASAQSIVSSTLERHNIICYMEGSLGYAVMVPKDKLKEATTALLENPELTKPWLIILQDGTIPKSVLKGFPQRGVSSG
jgi:hypothetical protein